MISYLRYMMQLMDFFLGFNTELSNEANSKAQKNRKKVKQNKTKTGQGKKETWKVLRTSYLRLRKQNQK